MSRSLCRRFQVTTPTAKRATYSPSHSTARPRSLLQQRRLQESRIRPGTAAENLAGSGGLCRETESLRHEVRLRQRLAGLIQLENFSAWNGLPFASKNNGFDGTDAVLEFNKPEQVKHIAMLEEMNKKGDFSYVGRKDESTEKFYNGDCAMTTASSGSLANIREYAKFNYGVGMMPYDADAKDAPQNAIIGGASLWVMQGKDKETYTGVAKFLDFLAKPENAAEWHQKTGYLPITKAAYDLTREQGFYEKNPGADTATRQMLNKPPLPFTKGLRLGNMPQIRVIVDEELESVWTGKKTPQQALDTAVERGNQLLRRFEKSTKS